MAQIDYERLKAEIPGWGSDLATERRPGVPRERTPRNGTGAHWKEPAKQIPKVKIYHSAERPGITPVFGTSAPPRLFSGKLRDLAYVYSEGRFAHWLLLLAADRIDVVESYFTELLQGRPENPLSEMGLKAEFKRGGQLERFTRRRSLAIAAGLGAAGVLGAFALKSQGIRRQDYSRRTNAA